MPCYHCNYKYANPSSPCDRCGGVGVPLKGSLVWQAGRLVWWIIKLPFRIIGWGLKTLR